MNRNVLNYLVVGIFALIFIFIFPLFLSPSSESYFRTISLLIPVAIVLFIAPTATHTLSKWDIHFDFTQYSDKIRPTVSNLGIIPFNFNRITLASGKKFKFFGNRYHCPAEGIFDSDVECHGADFPSRVLHEHTGCTIKQGLPVTIWVRSSKIPEFLNHFSNKKKIHLCLYYYGAKQKVYSDPIPINLVDFLTKPETPS